MITTIENENNYIHKAVKMSKYNFIVNDYEGNLILYNFLKGLPSLTKIIKSDVDKFSKIFLTDSIIHTSYCEKHVKVIKKLLESGILVYAGADESVLYDAKYYEEIYDNRLDLTVLPTGKCNLNCPYCLELEQPFSRNRMTIEAQSALLKFVQKNIKNHNELYVSWFGGEPLLETQMIKYLSENMIKICKAHLIPYSAEITTNGFLLDNDTFDMLYKQKVYNYMITLDGFKEQHDKLRCTHNGTGTYDTILSNLLWIRNNKQYRFAHINIRINITRAALNVLDEFIYYIDSLFSNDPRFTFLFIPVKNYSTSKPTDDTFFISDEELHIRLHNNAVYTKKFYAEELKTYLINPGQGCLSSRKNSYTITPDLKVYKCCAHYDMRDNNIGYIDLKGNLSINESLHNRWYLINEFIKRSLSSCRDCYYMPACTNNGKNCPFQYLKKSQEVISCPLKDDQFIKTLKETILYASNRYTCQTIAL